MNNYFAVAKLHMNYILNKLLSSCEKITILLIIALSSSVLFYIALMLYGYSRGDL